MHQKNYIAIKKENLNDKTEIDFKIWEIVYIKAFNYHEARYKLRSMKLKHDYHLIPGNVLRYRDIVYGETNGISN